MSRVLAFLSLMLVLLVIDGATACADDAKEAAYGALVAAAKTGNGPVDGLALRSAYADSSGFDVFGARIQPMLKPMYEAYEAGRFADAAAQAGQILDLDYVDLDAHIMCDLANRKVGNAKLAQRHHEIARALLRSIMTGDGRSPAAAFTVITVGEEYGVLRALGLKPTQQALIRDGGHMYDRLDTVDRQGNSRSIYFLIDRVVAAENAAVNARRP